MTRCTGHCCRAFVLNNLKDFESFLAVVDQVEDGPYVRDMVISIGKNDDGIEWYTCKHLDEASGDCIQYESRPRMCRNHPGQKQCPFIGCTHRGIEIIADSLGSTSISASVNVSETI